ncbi:MAG: YitT family protein [Anaeroplasma sp.]
MFKKYIKPTKKQLLDVFFRLFIVFVANILLAFTTVWFLEPAQLYAGGATGIAQLLNRLFSKIDINIDLGWFILFINIPIVLIGFKFVSRKFAIYSVIAVIVQSVATILIPTTPFYELENQIQAYIQNKSSIPFELYGAILTLSICGGVLAGIASGFALRYGTSTGGLDVAAQALALKKNVSIGNLTMLLNITIAIVGGGIFQGIWIIALFTIIRMILNSLVVDKIHTSYTYTSLHIFSDKSEEIAKEIIEKLQRGCTFEPVKGGYSKKESFEVYCVLSTYEVDKALKIIKDLDDKAFVTLSPVKRIRGKFIKKTII